MTTEKTAAKLHRQLAINENKSLLTPEKTQTKKNPSQVIKKQQKPKDTSNFELFLLNNEVQPNVTSSENCQVGI